MQGDLVDLGEAEVFDAQERGEGDLEGVPAQVIVSDAMLPIQSKVERGLPNSSGS